MANGTPSTSGLPAGATKASSHRYITPSPLTPIWSRLLWIVPSLKKNGGTKNQALGCCRGGFSTKIHVTVGGLGNPLRIDLTPGQRHDIAEALIIGYNSEHVIGDKGYDADDFITIIKANGRIAMIPSRSHRVEPRKYDQHLYKERRLNVSSTRSNGIVASSLGLRS